MKRQQQPNKLQLNKKRRSERDVTLSGSSSLQSEAQPGTSSSGITYLRRPPLPPSRIAAVEPASESGASAKPRDEKSLLEKLVAEMEEKEKDHHCGGIVKWTPLPPPNLELYLRKPVVLLEWDDGMTSNSELDLTDDRPTNDTDVIIITDDDSFADLDIGELTARLEDIEKELSFHSSQDEDHGIEIVKNQGGAIGKGENDHIPPAPDFTDDGDDNDYGSGSDMDLFGDDDYDRLYDNVDQQLQQGQEDQRKSLSSVDFSLPALVEVGHHQSSTPTATAIPPHSRESSTDSHGDDVIMKELIFQQGEGSQQDESKPPLDPRREGGGSLVGSRLHQTMVETSLETVRQFTDSNPPEQLAAPRARSSSSAEHKLSSPDSDDPDPPPVNWGRGSSRVASAVSISSAAAAPSTSTTSAGTSYSKRVIKTEHFEQPRPHCSKDILQSSSSSSSTSYQPPPLVAEKCPICNISFPTGYTQLEVDEHVAVCLSAMDWEDQDEGAAEF